jgi:hypothetical protein
MEIAGSVTNSQRALQWREKVVDPVPGAKGDHEITRLLATKLGFAEELFKHIGVENGEPMAKDITRELDRSAWLIGCTGQSPERMKLHMQHHCKFDSTALRGMSGPGRGRALLPAVALLGQYRDAACGHADPVGSLQAGRRGRHRVPRPLGSGKVDCSWMKQHPDLYVEEIEGRPQDAPIGTVTPAGCGPRSACCATGRRRSSGRRPLVPG